jgi:predicted metalloprotease with PDZ domain
MKKLILIAVIMLSSQAFASYTVSNLVAYTIAEAIYSTALPVATSEATSITTEDNRKEAVQLKNDVQDYYQTGTMCLSLQNKVIIAQKIDSSLSLDESLDALVDASNIILN